MYYLSRIPVDGSYLSDLLPGLARHVVGVGAVFVAVNTAANAGVPTDKAGLAAGLLNTSQQLGAALGLAVFSAIATSHANDLLASGDARAAAHRRLPPGSARLQRDTPRRCPHRTAHRRIARSHARPGQRQLRLRLTTSRLAHHHAIDPGSSR